MAADPPKGLSRVISAFRGALGFPAANPSDCSKESALMLECMRSSGATETQCRGLFQQLQACGANDCSLVGAKFLSCMRRKSEGDRECKAAFYALQRCQGLSIDVDEDDATGESQ